MIISMTRPPKIIKSLSGYNEKYDYIIEEMLNEWNKHIEKVRNEISSYQRSKAPIKRSISEEDLIKEITKPENDLEKSRVYILLGADINSMRETVSNVLTESLNSRRKNKTTNPVLFLLDEAHEYIPSSPQDDVVKNASRAVENMVRQGRKYHLGCCIATQRTRLLNTSIIGQLHTYFVGTLPRKEDRAVISDAFQMDEEMLMQTLAYNPGEWLVASYNAMGVKNRPISIYIKNELDVIKNQLDERTELATQEGIEKKAERITEGNGRGHAEKKEMPTEKEIYILFDSYWDKLTGKEILEGFGIHSKRVFRFSADDFKELNQWDVIEVEFPEGNTTEVMNIEKLYDGEYYTGNRKFDQCLWCNEPKEKDDKPFHYRCWLSLRDEYYNKKEES